MNTDQWARTTEVLEEVATYLQRVASVERHPVNEQITQVVAQPSNVGALPISWLELGRDEVILQAGHRGGRWELPRTPKDMEWLKEVVESVVEGRAKETFAPGRSHVEVVLTEGKVARETGYAGLVGMVPMPGWKRWGRAVSYEAYARK